MELKEWRRLAVQSVSLFLAVFICCICFAERLQEDTGDIVSAEVKRQADIIVRGTDDEPEIVPGVEEVERNPEEVRKKIVVIDAGHGGIDEGTSSRNGKYLEKEFTLLITERLKKLLEKEGIAAYYTRTDDRFVTKKKRVKQAKQLKADLLISIHCNAAAVGDATSNGMETLYCGRKTNNSSMTNKKLAQIMLNELVKETGLRKRGVIRRDKLYVLGHSDIPSTIVEVGYISNMEDLKFIRKGSGQQKIAQGICNGIVKALEE